MKRLFKKLLLSLLIGSCSLTFSSCFGFGDEAIEISSITTVTLENGDIQVIITYVDEDMKPTTFVVPKGDSGEDGKDGNGIKEITSKQSEDGLNTLVNITFTQENVEPIEVKVPNGVSIVNIEKRFEEETQCTYIKFLFTDGSESEEYAIPKGEPGKDGIDGKDGISIVDIIPTVNRDYSVTLQIVLSEGEPVEVLIPAPEKGDKGDDGKEIADITAEYAGDKYVVKVTYNDESTNEIEFARPNRWFTDRVEPEGSIVGDLWYDIDHQIIYIRQNVGGTDRWVSVMNFADVTEDPFRVDFYLNDSIAEPAYMPSGTLNYYEIEPNKNFYSSGYEMPEPTRVGYEFAGWYTVKNPGPAHGAFTDLTLVMSETTLYAKWIKIED